MCISRWPICIRVSPGPLRQSRPSGVVLDRMSPHRARGSTAPGDERSSRVRGRVPVWRSSTAGRLNALTTSAGSGLASDGRSGSHHRASRALAARSRGSAGGRNRRQAASANSTLDALPANHQALAIHIQRSGTRAPEMARTRKRASDSASDGIHIQRSRLTEEPDDGPAKRRRSQTHACAAT
jgi:hypothetical protein